MDEQKTLAKFTRNCRFAIPDTYWMLSVINYGWSTQLTIKLYLYKDSDKKSSEQKLSCPAEVGLAILNKERAKKYPQN